MKFGLNKWFALMIAAADLPYRRAIEYIVSPRTTVWVVGGAPGVGEGPTPPDGITST